MSRWPSELSTAEPAAASQPGAGWRAWRPGACVVLTDTGLWNPLAQHRDTDFAAWCQAHPGQVVDLWIAGPLVHHLVCRHDIPLADAAAVMGYARQLFAHYHGATAQRWPIAPWRSSAVRGATALHGADADALRAAGERHGVRIRSLRPLWAAALQWAARNNSALATRPTARLAIAEGALVTWLRLQRGRCVDVVTSRLASPSAVDLADAVAAADVDDLSPVFAMGYGLSGGLPATEACTWLGSLNASGPPASWFQTRGYGAFWRALPRPEFTSVSGPHPPALAWASLACAAAVFATALLQTHRHWQALQAGDAMLKASAAQSTTSDGLPPAHASAGEMNPGDARALSLALHRPWGHWMAAVEASAGTEVKWLELEHDANAGDIWRLKGQALEAAAALRAATELSTLPGWREARVSRLQSADQGMPVLFEISGRTQPLMGNPP